MATRKTPVRKTESLGAKTKRLARQCETGWIEWLEANGFPRDLNRAIRIAVAELGEFATTRDADDVTLDYARDLLQTCVDRRQWLAKIRTATTSASSVDRDRLKFFDGQKELNKRLKYKNAADMWNKQEHDHCDEGSFRQSCWRARKNVTT